MDGPVTGIPHTRAEVVTSVGGAAAETGSSGARVARSFDEFFRSEFPRLLTLARALCGSAAADDVAQEAMVAAYRRWAQIVGYDSPEAWVRRVCVRKATSVVRSRSAEARAVLQLRARRPASATVELEPPYDAFWSEVRRLPKRQAQAAALRYVYGMSLAEIAATMGCSEGAVKSHLSRARTVLVLRLELEGGASS
jgi:RNA polymerase sigma factor (sigma-70 family)